MLVVREPRLGRRVGAVAADGRRPGRGREPLWPMAARLPRRRPPGARERHAVPADVDRVSVARVLEPRAAGHHRGLAPVGVGRPRAALVLAALQYRTCSRPRIARAPSLANGRPLTLTPRQPAWLYTCTASPDGKMVGCGGAARVITTYDPRKWRTLARWGGCLKYEVTGLHYSSSNDALCFVRAIDSQLICGQWSGANTDGNMRSFRADSRWVGLAKVRARAPDLAPSLPAYQASMPSEWHSPRCRWRCSDT